MSIAKLSIAAALLSATTLSAQAQQSQTPEEVAATAQAQIESHASPAPTLNMLKECIDAYPKAPNIGKLYMLSGACMLASGNYDEAEEYLRMPQAAKVSETPYWLGELAMAAMISPPRAKNSKNTRTVATNVVTRQAPKQELTAYAELSLAKT